MRFPFVRSEAAVSPRQPPSEAQLAALPIETFVARLDASVGAISKGSSLAALLSEKELAIALGDPRFAEADALFRGTLRGLLVATSFRDIPEEARVHPHVQDRMWAAMDDMDTAACGMADALASLTHEECSLIQNALRNDPGLSETVLSVLERESEKAGVSDERKAHLRRMGNHACFRLRQSTAAFISEYKGKVARAKPRDIAEASRLLEAQWGKATYQRESAFQSAMAEKWQEILSKEEALFTAPSGPSGPSSDDAYAPPTAPLAPPPGGRNPERGKTVLRVGAWLFGLGLAAGATGGILVSAHDDDIQIAGLFTWTAAALLSLGGIICLIVGAILRHRARQAAELETNASQ